MAYSCIVKELTNNPLSNIWEEEDCIILTLYHLLSENSSLGAITNNLEVN